MHEAMQLLSFGRPLHSRGGGEGRRGGRGPALVDVRQGQRRCRATCRCCATTDAEGVILTRTCKESAEGLVSIKDSVEGLVSGTNIIFRGGFEFVHIISEGAQCAGSARVVGGRGMHRCCCWKKSEPRSSARYRRPRHDGFYFHFWISIQRFSNNEWDVNNRGD